MWFRIPSLVDEAEELLVAWPSVSPYDLALSDVFGPAPNALALAAVEILSTCPL